jgi:hypothetical protein
MEQLKTEKYNGYFINFDKDIQYNNVIVSFDTSKGRYTFTSPNKEIGLYKAKLIIDSNFRTPLQDFYDEDDEPDYDAAANYIYSKSYGELTADEQRKVEEEVRFSGKYYHPEDYEF